MLFVCSVTSGNTNINIGWKGDSGVNTKSGTRIVLALPEASASVWDNLLLVIGTSPYVYFATNSNTGINTNYLYQGATVSLNGCRNFYINVLPKSGIINATNGNTVANSSTSTIYVIGVNNSKTIKEYIINHGIERRGCSLMLQPDVGFYSAYDNLV